MRVETTKPPSPPGPPTSDLRPRTSAPLRRFYIAAALITLAFTQPLYRWAAFAWNSELHSFVLLIPFVSLYLLRTARAPSSVPRPRSSDLRPTGDPQPSTLNSQPSRLGAGFSAVLGLAALVSLATSATLRQSATAVSLTTAAYLLFLLAAALATVGWPAIKARLFPVAFLAFMIPLPPAAVEAISIGLQYASADAADVTMRLTGMPVYRDGLSFKLPGLTVFVAEECSGIRSTLVLFVTSLVAGYVLLRRPGHRFIIAALVFPLGVLRNAFRITTICWLSSNVDPGILDSPLHHRGGPLFFAVSLFPLFVALAWFRKRESTLDAMK